MKVNNDHMYHGAALTQIAEHPEFTAINAFKTDTGISRSTFRINDDIGIYLKYATEPKGPYHEYRFTFSTENLRELKDIAAKTTHVHLALVCVQDRQICCLSYEKLLELIQRRRDAKGMDEDQYTVLVTVHAGKSFRVYINTPGAKKKTEGKPLVIPRDDFPDKLFK